ncbi:MAG: hypothetical protein HY794_10020 [Desulfarculus sp.]|nr:hypothetical protein [Desulfarculus sp.]
MTVDVSPDTGDKPNQEGGMPWPELLARLGQAVEALQQDEVFRAPELLAAQPGVDPAWNWRGDPKETWEAVNAWREHGGQMPPRAQALVTALHMLLADLLLSAAPARTETGLTPAQIWQAGTLADRLRLYYRLSSTDAAPGSGGPAAYPTAMLQEEEEAQLRVARRWESELLPMAVGLVLSEARLVVPYEVCKQLVQRRGHGLLNWDPSLSDQGRQWVHNIAEVLPEVVAIMHERFRGIFREVEPNRWEYLKPDPEEVAMYIRARLHSHRPPAVCLNRVRGFVETVEDNGQQAEEDFLKAFRVLVAKGMRDEVRQALTELDKELAGGKGKELLSEAQRLGIKEGDASMIDHAPLRFNQDNIGQANSDGLGERLLRHLSHQLMDSISRFGITKHELLVNMQNMVAMGEMSQEEFNLLSEAINQHSVKE